MNSRAAYAVAADEFAARVLLALRGAGDTGLVARHIDTSPDVRVALAAVRVIGADTFTPHILTRAPFSADDALAVVRSFTDFPAAPSGCATRAERHTAAWRDWATVQLLARTGADGVRRVLAPPPTEDTALLDTTDWAGWSVRMAQLSPLATPGLDGPVHEAARAGVLPLSRGMTRSILRRDFPTAVRLIRWLALLQRDGARLPLELGTALEHLRLLSGENPRTALDLAVAGHLLTDGASANGPKAADA